MNGMTFQAVAGRIVGNARAWEMDWEPAPVARRSVEMAITDGFKLWECDDFNIAVLDEGKLVAVRWIEGTRDQSVSELTEVGAALGVPVAPESLRKAAMVDDTDKETT